MAEESLNLFQKLAKIRNIADVAKKSKQGFNYTYADITDILAKVTAGMNKYNVSLIPSITPGTARVEQHISENTRFDKTGKSYLQKTTEWLFSSDMVFRWVDNNNPGMTIDVAWHVVGSQSDPSQGFGSGLTYCTRYFLTSYFQIAQDNDVDAYRSKQKEAEASEDKAIAEAIISEFDSVVKPFLVDNQDKSEEVKKFISKYAKGANYFAIKDPALASKLLTDFKNKYINIEEKGE